MAANKEIHGMSMSDLTKKIDLEAKKGVLSAGKRFRSDEEASEEETSEEEISEPYVKPPYIEIHRTLPSIEIRKKCFLSTGNCMMELFRVIINREGYISGKIFIDNGRVKDVYKAEEEEYVSEGGDLLLPGAVLPTYDCVLIFADLNHKTTKSCRSSRFNEGSYSEESRRLTNCDVCFDEGRFNESKYRGFYWHYCQPNRQHFLNTPLSYKITSGELTATLLFAIFYIAILATVEVRLINESSERIGVYGLITARNSMFEDSRYKCILFRKKFTERLALVPEDPIQLSRSVLTVPVKFNLIVRVDLRSKDINIPCGELTFPVPVELSGMTEKLLGDKVQVKVTWKHHWR